MFYVGNIVLADLNSILNTVFGILTVSIKILFSNVYVKVF